MLHGQGLEPAPHFHTPNCHQEKRGLKVSSAESNSELLQSGAGSGWQGAPCPSLSGEVGALQSGGRSSLAFTLALTPPSPLQTVVHSPQLQG